MMGRVEGSGKLCERSAEMERASALDEAVSPSLLNRNREADLINVDPSLHLLLHHLTRDCHLIVNWE